MGDDIKKDILDSMDLLDKDAINTYLRKRITEIIEQKKEHFVKNNAICDLFCNWMSVNTKSTQNEDKIEISFPFLDRNNDCIQVYAKATESGYLLTDDGDTLGGMFGENITLKEHLVDMVLQNYGITKENEILMVETTYDDIPNKMLSLIQAIIAVESMAITNTY